MINVRTDLYAAGMVLGHADYQSTMRPTPKFGWRRTPNSIQIVAHGFAI